MQMLVNPDGEIRCLYEEAVDLANLGLAVITRASHVEPDTEGRWWADLGPVQGPNLGPFLLRSEALQAEKAWLETRWLVRPVSVLPPSTAD